MTSLGNNAHVFVRPHRRPEIAAAFTALFGEGSVREMNHPGITDPLLLVTFPSGGALSVEFTASAVDDDALPRLGAWLELRTDDPAAFTRAAVAAGLRRVDHPGHPYYIMIPGGQVFAVTDAGPRSARA